MNRIAKNYADALFDLAHEDGVDELVQTQFAGVRRLFDENPDYVKLLYAPNVPKSERLAALDEAFSGRVHLHLLSFLKLLSERGDIYEYADCEARFRSRCNAAHGIVEATAFTAAPLRPAQLERLRVRLGELTGKRVDPAVLGGIRLEYDGVELDSTVRRKLDGIGRTLSDTIL